MKLANWNVERASTKARRAALREATDAVAADLWVLTETRDSFHPGLPYSCSSAGWRDASSEGLSAYQSRGRRLA